MCLWSPSTPLKCNRDLPWTSALPSSCFQSSSTNTQPQPADPWPPNDRSKASFAFHFWDNFELLHYEFFWFYQHDWIMQIWAIFCHHLKWSSSWFRHSSPHCFRRSWGQGLMACPGRSAYLICWCLCQYPGPIGPFLGRRLNSWNKQSINSDLFKNFAKKDWEKFR